MKQSLGVCSSLRLAQARPGSSVLIHVDPRRHRPAHRTRAHRRHRRPKRLRAPPGRAPGACGRRRAGVHGLGRRADPGRHRRGGRARAGRAVAARGAALGRCPVPALVRGLLPACRAAPAGARRRAGAAHRGFGHRHHARADLAQPARLPGHRGPAGQPRQPARSRRAVGLRRRRRRRLGPVVHRARLRRAPAGPGARRPEGVARGGRGDRGGHGGARGPAHRRSGVWG